MAVEKEIVKKEFGTLDPQTEVNFASKAAKALQGIVESKKHKVIVGGKQYLQFEDWQTLARFFNYTVGVDWVRQLKNGDSLTGYEARAIVYNREGVVIGSAEASCLRDEKNWQDKPEFQLKSMAQTRASAKALRNILAWVSVLAGYEGTPAEEMDGVEVGSDDNNAPQGHTEPYFNGSAHIKPENRDKPATPAQKRAIYKIIAKKTGKTDSQENIDTNIKEVYSIDMATITMGEASELIETLQGE